MFTVVLFSCNNSQDQAVEKYNKVHVADNSDSATLAASYDHPTYTDAESDSMKIQGALETLDNIQRAKDRNDLSSIEDEVDQFKEIDNVLIYLGKPTGQAKLLTQKLKKLQTEDFPVLRKKYIEVAAKRLWEEDVKVYGSNGIITFVGGDFAAHRNIKESEEAIHDMLIKLRFKRVNFKWIEDDPDYTYYNLDSPADNE